MDNMEHRKAILSENLIRFVKANGWTEMEAARRGGFNPQTFYSWINKVSYPGPENLIRLAELFHCQIFELTEEKWYIDERKRFLTIGASDTLTLYDSNPHFAAWCRIGTTLAKTNRLEAYVKRIREEIK